MNAQMFQGLKELAGKTSALTFDESFHLAQECSRLLGNSGEDEARELVIRALENFDRIPLATREVWASLVEAVGLYPYLDPTVTESLAPAVAGESSLIRHEYHASPYLDGIFLHREQVRISRLLHEGKSVILSAPTSFGKSLLIQEVVASRKYRNLVIVQPTLALLDETRKKLQRYGDQYELVVSTTQRPSTSNNIFLFTGERVVEYRYFPTIEFFVIDEFYKLSLARDDDRAITLNQALYLLLKHTPRCYLLGPSIRSVSAGLEQATGAEWIRSDYATVAVDVYTVNGAPPQRTRGISRRRAATTEKAQRLFTLLPTLKEPTLVYCASPAKASDLSLEYLGSELYKRSRARVPDDVKEMVEWIDENIHPKWSLRDLLAQGIAFHHGALPRHLASSIVDAFNAYSVNVLFCTSTLIEGVNTTARNVVLFDEAKGKKPIDYFDYKNIVGRSGRMKVHYIGKVFQLVRRPEQIELDVDVPLFTQASAPVELLVQMERGDLEAAARTRLDALRIEDEEVLKVLRNNAGITVQGQLALFREILGNPVHYYDLLRWTTIPRYAELAAVTELIWRFLLKPGDSRAGVSDRQLAVMTLQYVHHRSPRALIDLMVNSDYWRSREPDEHRRVQRVVYLVLNTTRQWFEYRLPRLLAAVSSIQDLAFRRLGRRPGNYTFLASQMESSFLSGSLAMLLDRDVPMSAVRKIEPHLGQPESWQQVVERLQSLDFRQMSLLPYEERKLRGSFTR